MAKALESQKLTRRKRRLFVWKLTGIIASLIVLIAFPIYLTHADFAQIQSIEVSNTEIVEESDIKSIVEAQLQENLLFVFARSNAALFPRKKIERNIELQYPRIRDAKVSLRGIRTLHVEITERQIAALWCDAGRQCFAMDSSGFIFDHAPEFSAEVYPVYGGGEREDPIGGYFLSDAKDLAALALYREGLAALGIAPQKIMVHSSDHAVAQYNEGSGIVFSLQDDPVFVLSNLESVLKDPQVEVFDGKNFTVREIDLRFGNKVILKRDAE